MIYNEPMINEQVGELVAVAQTDADTVSCLYLHGQMQARRVVAFTWTDTSTASWLYLHGQMQALRAVAFTWNGRSENGCFQITVQH